MRVDPRRLASTSVEATVTAAAASPAPSSSARAQRSSSAVSRRINRAPAGVDDVAQRLAGEEAPQVVHEDRDAALVLVADAGGPVRRDDHVVELPERASGGSGSVSKTSSAAPPSEPSRSRRTSAASSITAPRPTFVTTAPGLQGAEHGVVDEPARGVRERQRDDEAVGARRQLGQRVGRVDLVHVVDRRPGRALTPSTVIPSAFTSRAVSTPIAPSPTIRTVRPRSSSICSGRVGPVAGGLVGEQDRQTPARTRAARAARTPPAARRGRRRRW